MQTVRESLPSATRVGKVRLAVSDLVESLRFYGEVLGLAVIAPVDESGLVGLGVRGERTVLVELQQLAGVSPVGRRVGLYHVAILLPRRGSLGSFIQHLLALGVGFSPVDHLASEAVYLADPDGLEIEVYADRPRSEWPSEGKKLMLGAAPLKLAELKRIADGKWQGAPPGTTVGHVHFCVSDLGQAQNFYQTAMGFDLMLTLPGALFVSAGGYHHHVGLNSWAAGSPAASESDARLLFWELVLPDQAWVARVSERLRACASSVQEGDKQSPAFTDPNGIRVQIRAEQDFQYSV